jgi:hypothetical protein
LFDIEIPSAAERRRGGLHATPVPSKIRQGKANLLPADLELNHHSSISLSHSSTVDKLAVLSPFNLLLRTTHVIVHRHSFNT